MSTAEATTVGVIGVGRMGAPMAARLVGAGFAMSVHDRDDAAVERFVAAHGGHAAVDAREVAERSDFVITILPTSLIVADVIALDERSVLAGLRPGTVVIEMSSGQPSVTRRLAEQVAELGGAMIDAPVSGGVARARDGTLAIMAGGEAAVIDRAAPVLAAMGTVLRTGPIGSGQAMKALNNLVSAAGFLIGIEALLVGRRYGLDPATMVDVLNQSSGMNNSTQRKFRQFVLSRRFNSDFALDLMAKDITIALEIARESATPVPFAALCRELWVAAQGSLEPGSDHTELARFLERQVGTELS
jgi:3-hydroxyisobutyrate dehydrogenase